MLKIDNNIATQAVYDLYTRNSGSEINNNLQQTAAKDTFTRSTETEDKRYSFNTAATKETTKSFNPKVVKVSENLSAGTRFSIKSLENDKYKRSAIDEEFSGDLTYQLLQNINRDIQKQIDILNKYNLSKVNRLIKSIDSSILI